MQQQPRSSTLALAMLQHRLGVGDAQTHPDVTHTPRTSFLKNTPKPASTHLVEPLQVNLCGVVAGLAIRIIWAPATMTGCRNVRKSGPVSKSSHDEEGLQAGAWPGQSLPANKDSCSGRRSHRVYPPALWCRSGHLLCPDHSTIHRHSLTQAGLQPLT